MDLFRTYIEYKGFKSTKKNYKKTKFSIFFGRKTYQETLTTIQKRFISQIGAFKWNYKKHIYLDDLGAKLKGSKLKYKFIRPK